MLTRLPLMNSRRVRARGGGDSEPGCNHIVRARDVGNLSRSTNFSERARIAEKEQSAQGIAPLLRDTSLNTWRANPLAAILVDKGKVVDQ